jgi:hypothetical protein
MSKAVGSVPREALAKMAADIAILPFAGLGSAIGNLITAIASAMSATSAAEAAAKTYSQAPGAPVPSAVPAPTPHRAAGGVVIRPHVALVGEAGPEAIIPLKKGGGRIVRLDHGQCADHNQRAGCRFRQLCRNVERARPGNCTRSPTGD